MWMVYDQPRMRAVARTTQSTSFLGLKTGTRSSPILALTLPFTAPDACLSPNHLRQACKSEKLSAGIARDRGISRQLRASIMDRLNPTWKRRESQTDVSLLARSRPAESHGTLTDVHKCMWSPPPIRRLPAGSRRGPLSFSYSLRPYLSVVETTVACPEIIVVGYNSY